MYDTRLIFLVLVSGEGTSRSKAAKNGSVMHSANSAKTSDGAPMAERSTPSNVSITSVYGNRERRVGTFNTDSAVNT